MYVARGAHACAFRGREMLARSMKRRGAARSKAVARCRWAVETSRPTARKARGELEEMCPLMHAGRGDHAGPSGGGEAMQRARRSDKSTCRLRKLRDLFLRTSALANSARFNRTDPRRLNCLRAARHHADRP